MIHGRFTDAHIPDSAAAAFPVLAVVIISFFSLNAFDTTNALARSLRDPVGFFPSSLMNKSITAPS